VRTFREEFKNLYLVIFIGLFGVIIILLSNIYSNVLGQWKFFVDSIGASFLIAGVLGLTIDRVFRQQLAEDAFRASIGYILPEELKGEMKWIYESHIICVQHIQECEIKPINPESDICVLYVKMQRTLRNISNDRESITLLTAIDEWFHKSAKSQIIDFGYIKGDEKWPENINDIEIKKGENCSIIVKKEDIPLDPQEEIIVWSEIEEIKHINDCNYWVFLYPTKNPQVTVKAYGDIEIVAGFAYREKQTKKISDHTYLLQGTLLPYQIIQIRWWNKKDHDDWINKPAITNNIVR